MFNGWAHDRRHTLSSRRLPSSNSHGDWSAIEDFTITHFTRQPLKIPQSRWSTPETVQGFVQSPPNDTLVAFAAGERQRVPNGLALDIGCGAARNALPLARSGWRVIGTDNSRPMLEAARERSAGERNLLLLEATMDCLPVADRSADLIVAHGIWNLARTSAQLRSAVREAARTARPGAGLFLFTFSRQTLPDAARPMPGETFVFTQFAGEPQCFLTRDEILHELGSVGFVPDPAVPLTELNARTGMVQSRGPVIYQGAFRFVR
jgi:SAM-dependent methyltransferase